MTIDEAIKKLRFIPRYTVRGYECSMCGQNKLAHRIWPERCPVLRKALGLPETEDEAISRIILEACNDVESKNGGVTDDDAVIELLTNRAHNSTLGHAALSRAMSLLGRESNPPVQEQEQQWYKIQYNNSKKGFVLGYGTGTCAGDALRHFCYVNPLGITCRDGIYSFKPLDSDVYYELYANKTSEEEVRKTSQGQQPTPDVLKWWEGGKKTAVVAPVSAFVWWKVDTLNGAIIAYAKGTTQLEALSVLPKLYPSRFYPYNGDIYVYTPDYMNASKPARAVRISVAKTEALGLLQVKEAAILASELISRQAEVKLSWYTVYVARTNQVLAYVKATARESAILEVCEADKTGTIRYHSSGLSYIIAPDGSKLTVFAEEGMPEALGLVPEDGRIIWCNVAVPQESKTRRWGFSWQRSEYVEATLNYIVTASDLESAQAEFMKDKSIGAYWSMGERLLVKLDSLIALVTVTELQSRVELSAAENSN